MQPGLKDWFHFYSKDPEFIPKEDFLLSEIEKIFSLNKFKKSGSDFLLESKNFSLKKYTKLVISITTIRSKREFSGFPNLSFIFFKGYFLGLNQTHIVNDKSLEEQIIYDTETLTHLWKVLKRSQLSQVNQLNDKLHEEIDWQIEWLVDRYKVEVVFPQLSQFFGWE